MANAKIGKQAVVIGAGMAGSAAAGALADQFERVTVLERDRLPDQAVPRSGAAQSRHIHILLAGGQRALSDLFPHFLQDFTDAGAVPIGVSHEQRIEIPRLGPLPSRDLGWQFYSASRPLMELITRRQAKRLSNVTIRPECRVLDITTTPAGAAVTGVKYESADGQQDILTADLVVDASGRAAPTLALLRSLGQPVPDETVIGVDLHYTTTTFTIPRNAPVDWKNAVTHPRAPEPGRGGYLLPIEGNRWILTLSGQRGEQPPAEPDGFMDYLRRLETQTLYNAVRNAERQSGFERYGFPDSTWRHFDRLKAFPRGLLPIGDSICRFNPIYGQGMSVAAQEARLLKQLLQALATKTDPLAALAPAFFTESLPLVEAPWNMSAVPDLAYPGTRGERPADFEQRLKYNAALARAAIRDGSLHRLMTEVVHLLKPPKVLEDPAVDKLVQHELAQMAAAEAQQGPSVGVEP